MKRDFLAVLVGCVVMCGMASATIDGDQVDICKGTSYVQAGFTAWNSPSNGATLSRSMSWDSSFNYKINGDYNSGPSATPAGATNPWLAARDIGDGGSYANEYPAPYTNLNHDGVFSGYEIWLQIQNLDAGDYAIKTYHNSYTGYDAGSIELRVTDATRNDALLYDDVVLGTSGDGTSEGSPSPIDPLLITFTANGTDDVIIHIIEDVVAVPSGFGIAMLNGMELAAVPEPATMTLLGLGSLALLRRKK